MNGTTLFLDFFSNAFAALVFCLRVVWRALLGVVTGLVGVVTGLAEEESKKKKKKEEKGEKEEGRENNNRNSGRNSSNTAASSAAKREKAEDASTRVHLSARFIRPIFVA